MSNPSNKLLSDITAFRTYSKYLKHLSRRETLSETINRNMTMHLDRFPKLSKDIVKAYQRVHDLKVMPSMRSLQFSGDAILKNNVRLFNCSAVAIDNPRVFAEILYVLLSGAGVGFSVQSHHINTLPKVKIPKEETRFLINDSIMGWAQSVEMLVNAYFFGSVRPLFDYSLVRPKGSYMVTTGAKAPGPAPLKFMLELVESKLKLALGRKLTSLECHDIVCIISDAVLAGGIRRSSLISLFDKDDKQMLTCKHGEWWNHAPWRARANNSAVLLRSENDRESFDNIFQMCRDSNAGEPGIFFSNSKELLTNPCQPSFAKVMLASGKEITFGELKIGDILLSRENKETVVLNKWSTGVKPVYVYGVTGGSFVGTADHKLVCKKAGTDVIEKLPAQFLYENSSTYAVLTMYGYQSLETEVFIGTHEVFDITVSDDTHTYLTNGIYVSNCSEISLHSNQFCVGENTTILARNGVFCIKDSINKNIEIWNGASWSTVTPYKTGKNTSLYRVTFSDGSYVDVTGYHKFLIKKDREKVYHEVNTLELQALLSAYKRSIKIPRANVSVDLTGNVSTYSYEYGFFLGDGHVDHGLLKASLFNEKKNLPLRGRMFPKEYFNSNKTSYKTIEFNTLDKKLGYDLKKTTGIPEYFKNLDMNSTLSFFAGWIDADGSKANNGCRLYGKECKLRDAQVLLTRIGIVSSINLMQKKGVSTNFGVRNYDIWYLQIPDASKIPSKRLDLSKGSPAKMKGKDQIVKNITKLDGLYDTYCLTEPILNQCVFNNVLTKQCNLSTINQTGITNKRDFMNRVYAASLIGTLQASYTDFDYLNPRWKETTDTEALLGVSFTGIADNSGFITAELLSEGAKFAIEVNEKYASKIGINSAYRVTCLKPEGSASCVLSSSSGIHARHAEYYIRRIRMNADDALGVYLKSVMPDLVEADLFSSTGIVVSLPQESPKNSIIRSNESALDLFNRTMFYHDNWINPGHKSGLNKHNVSVTISLRDEEWDILRDKMWENRHRYTGISLLPYTGGNYQQAPFEEIDQQKYDEMVKLVKDVDLSKVIEEDDNTERTETLACVGGLCEIT